ncbi:hypothetical protein LY76DRAFT_610868 [Colletotrichum caudatum]|nr:hypothetical protein LY76DRAFT_610868 [Colletotrichum caudatum]
MLKEHTYDLFTWENIGFQTDEFTKGVIEPEFAGNHNAIRQLNLAREMQAYLLAQIYKHSGCICRIYNNLGSISRDAMEENINSLNYPKFDHTVAKEKKGALWDIA